MWRGPKSAGAGCGLYAAGSLIGEKVKKISGFEVVI